MVNYPLQTSRNLFLFPLAGIALFIKHRQAGKIPMLIWTIGLALLVAVLGCVKIVA